MTLENTLRQQLSDPETGGFYVAFGGWTVTLVADQRDRMSCALKELTLNNNGPIAEELPAWAERVARQASGLMEPLRVLEVDELLGKAVLRSQAPTLQGGKAFYYELLLERTTRTSASLRRYAGANGEPREAVLFVLTNDAVVKLATDIVGEK
jgi:hypothetical protein